MTMRPVVNVHDFKTNYSKYLAQVLEGNEILLAKHGKPVAKIISLPHANKQKRALGQLKGKVRMSNDFDMPMTDIWHTIATK